MSELKLCQTVAHAWDGRLFPEIWPQVGKFKLDPLGTLNKT